MSAYMCSDETLKLIAVTASLSKYDRERFNTREVQIKLDWLTLANQQSLDQRYEPGDMYNTEHRPTITDAELRHYANWERFNEATRAKVCANWDYQSCERDDYKNTKGYEVYECALRNIMGRLPGYESAPWGLNPEHGVPAPALAPVARNAQAEARHTALSMPKLKPDDSNDEVW